MGEGHATKFWAGWAAVNTGDVDGVLRFLDPQIEWDMSHGFPDGPVYHGHAGVRDFFDDVAKLWQEFRIEIEDVREVADHVVVAGWWSATGRGSTVPVRARGGWFWRLRDGKAILMRFYSDPHEAFEALALAIDRRDVDEAIPA
jgi:ketosteroid isomerase-like protein